MAALVKHHRWTTVIHGCMAHKHPLTMLATYHAVCSTGDRPKQQYMAAWHTGIRWQHWPHIMLCAVPVTSPSSSWWTTVAHGCMDTGTQAALTAGALLTGAGRTGPSRHRRAAPMPVAGKASATRDGRTGCSWPGAPARTGRPCTWHCKYHGAPATRLTDAVEAGGRKMQWQIDAHDAQVDIWQTWKRGMIQGTEGRPPGATPSGPRRYHHCFRFPIPPALGCARYGSPVGGKWPHLANTG